MTDEPDHPLHPRDAARHDRLRDALRANLKRRKQQARGRALMPGEAPDTAPAGQDGAPGLPSRQAGPDESF